jgi:hypothetical protein
MVKFESGIREKHPGSATLFLYTKHKLMVLFFTLVPFGIKKWFRGFQEQEDMYKNNKTTQLSSPLQFGIQDP